MLENYEVFEGMKQLGTKKVVQKNYGDIERDKLKEEAKGLQADLPKAFLHRIDMLASRLP